MLTIASNLDLIQQQRSFFATGKTKDIEFRITQLKTLKAAIETHESEILEALQQDLNKPSFEAIAAELTLCIEEINYSLKQIKKWAKPKKAKTLITQFPASGRIMAEPLGVVLIISPWNYPFQLGIAPLIGAIAAGNCAILKPSELAPHTSSIIAKILGNSFPSEYIAVVEGDKEITQDLLQHKFDHIFFTGGTKIGKIIMEAAAQYLTPVTLELGGKSPCIVTPDTHLEYTARRIVWGKFINAGQTCIAPDYLLVHPSIKQPLIEAMVEQIKAFYGENPAASSDYARIISAGHFQRLTGLIEPEKVIYGGESEPETRYIAPTLLDGVTWEDEVMADEIFGPILPILEYESLENAIAQINQRPKPLALYLFTTNKKTEQQVLTQTSSGGVCINDTIMHIASPQMPFGGVGDSGMGAYHGKATFDTFSHYKSVLTRSFLFDLKLRYPPYEGKLKYIKMLLK
ncbi:aldehyde dehydrogenase [Spirulina subsalsa FACHB-351]|uniref:Aldehyde dehydrogenase n=1 Tax=Spirulina subsalsa FACHB-351 TaxID=234711 RepID=A0ABT3L4N9_9CYAN|nr:aldehyde dehydrogenase [Spirulina subsalsa]MCW6036483.1 aldehyde dehydrogenase [Spirulina subsalsa FACHB-351]